MPDDTVLSCKTDEDLVESVESFADKYGYTKSQAIKHLLETGLREQRSPILNVWRETAQQASLYIVLVAVCAVVLGLVPGVIEPRTAGMVAGVLVTIAVSLNAAIELARVARGSSPLGGLIRGDWR